MDDPHGIFQDENQWFSYLDEGVQVKEEKYVYVPKKKKKQPQESILKPEAYIEE
tara:strand:+ start:208 stop:369 length:162 start_codon:yes stop_codon:yes gene_type:complete